MTELRKQLQLAQEGYRKATYPGDIAAIVAAAAKPVIPSFGDVRRAPVSPNRLRATAGAGLSWRARIGIGAGLAAAAALTALLLGDEVLKTPPTELAASFVSDVRQSLPTLASDLEMPRSIVASNTWNALRPTPDVSSAAQWISKIAEGIARSSKYLYEVGNDITQQADGLLDGV